MAYDLDKDYQEQLKELRDEEFDLELYDPPMDYAVVKLMYFEPRDTNDNKSGLLLPDQTSIIGGNTTMTADKLRTSNQLKYAGARAVVRVIKYGNFSRPDTPEYAEKAPLLKEWKLWRVMPNEIEGTTINPDFQYEASQTLEKNSNTGKAAIDATSIKKIERWKKFWIQYIFKNPLKVSQSAGDDEFEYLFEIPLRKLKGPIKL